MLVVMSLVTLLGAACRGPREGASDAEPTKIEAKATDAAQRALACQRAWSDGTMGEYVDCFGEPFSYRNNLGSDTQALEAFVQTSKASRKKLEDVTRRSIVVIADGDAVFDLWVESATVDGEQYGILSAQFWLGLDDDGAFHQVEAYLDPNHVQHQLGKAPELSRGRVALPKIEPHVLKRDDASAQATLSVVRKQVQAFNDHDVDALGETYAPAVRGVATTRSKDYRSRDQLLDPLPTQWSAHPNVEMEVVRLWGAGDFAVLEGVLQGTNTGSLAGMPATGRSFEQPFVEVLEVKDGAVIRFWRVADSLSVLRQLGFSE